MLNTPRTFPIILVKKYPSVSAGMVCGCTHRTQIFFSLSIGNWYSTISIGREQINSISRVTNAGRDCGSGPLTAIARFVHARMDGKTRYHLYLPFNSLSSYLFPTLKMPDDDSEADGDDFGMWSWRRIDLYLTIDWLSRRNNRDVRIFRLYNNETESCSDWRLPEAQCKQTGSN